MRMGRYGEVLNTFDAKFKGDISVDWFLTWHATVLVGCVWLFDFMKYIIRFEEGG